METEDVFSFSIEYNTDIYKEETIERYMTHFENLLNVIISSPTLSICEYMYMDQLEYNLVTEKAAISKDLSKPGITVIELFEKQVAKTPAHIAVEFEEAAIDYETLNQLSNQLAYYLKNKHQVSLSDRVGVMLERNEWMIVSLLAILKTGASYIPIDPEYPTERVEYMLKESDCKYIIDNAQLNDFFKEKTKYPVYNPEVNILPDDLAYVIYTSGTSGKPKGVMISHYSVLNYVQAFCSQFKLAETDKVIQQSSLSFDTHVEEMFPALISGAAVLISKKGGADINGLYTLIKEKQATVLSTTPLVINELNAKNINIHQLRLLISGGDVLNMSHISNFPDDLKIYNTYGPTETTVCATFFQVNKSHQGSVFIGNPFNNISIYILDEFLKPVPIGVTGEIYIGGKGLAKGYINQPDLTKEKFIDNPFVPQSKLYRTGDCGRWKEGMLIEYYGRKDKQVKIRGYRIELREIETSLLTYQEVEDAIVMISRNNYGENELTGYVLSKQPLGANDLKKHLHKMLPKYMIPANIIVLANFPLTVNGKVNQQELLKLAGSIQSEKKYIPPVSHIELQFAEIWKEVLDVERISMNDDFFELGGNSIKSIKLQYLLKERLQIDIKTTQVYYTPDIAGMINIQNNVEDHMSILLSKELTADKMNMYMIPPLFGNAIVYKDLSEQLSDQYNCYGLNYKGLENDAERVGSIEEMADVICNEIIKLQGHNRFGVMGYSMGAVIAFEIVKRLEKKFGEIDLILIDKEVRQVSQVISNKRIEDEVEHLFDFYDTYVGGAITKPDHLRGFLTNNVNILNSYKLQDSITSNIFAVEASEGGFSTQMQNWKKYTTGKVELLKVPVSHWNLLHSNAVRQYAPALNARVNEKAIIGS